MFCSRCGNEYSEGAAFCSRCGAPIAGTGVAQPAPAPPGTVATVAGAAPMYYAGFWLRLVALILDGIILAIPVLFVFALMVVGFGLSVPFRRFPRGEFHDAFLAGAGFHFIFWIALISFVLYWIYYAIFESSSWQATPGKMILGLYVADLDGRRITFGRASGRFFGKLVSKYLTIYIGFIMAGFTARKQALHDILASCLVLRKI
ncbi:MAG TPA: RDD family protein [Candidatus Sulfotelmatobacter sp.]|nr:RDD family protein [Candidatus Sulfotelmatobacter sp.]